jgi:hypothetical protein
MLEIIEMSSDLFPIKEYIYQDLKLELTSLCIYKLIYKDIEIGSIRQDKVYNKSTYFHNTLNKHLNPSLAKTFQGSLSSRLIKEFNSCKIEDILDELYNYIKENYVF